MQTFTIQINIHDECGDGHYDYTEDYLIDIDTDSGKFVESRDSLLNEFKTRVRLAALDWFAADPDTVKDCIETYGYGYDYDADGSKDGMSEPEYMLSVFPARCITRIPDDIKHTHGFRDAPAPNCVYHVYDDAGFFR